MMKKFLLVLSPVLMAIVLTRCTSQRGSDKNWPQYRNDSGRTGYTSQQIAENLAPRWVHNFGPADKSWTGIHTRMTFDYAIQPVISGNYLYAGSSNDNQIYAINRKTGKVIWTFYTDGPVRFAPAVYNKKIYAVSDDGYCYCLSAKKGKLIWKKSGGPSPDLILGNGKMISRWPARGGVVIKDGVLYFGAGIWPSEKIFIYALDPESGDVLWVNDSSGEIEMPQPHGGAVAKSGLSAQGYLVTGGDKLFVPTGRAVPAALDLQKGELAYFHLQQYRNMGGSAVMAIDSFMLVPSGNTREFNEIEGTSYSIFSNSDGMLVPGEINSEAVAVSPEYIYAVNNDSHQIEAYNRKNLIESRETLDRRGNKTVVKKIADPEWQADLVKDYAKTLIIAGDKLVAGTATGKVLIIDSKNGNLLESYEVNGTPLGLAAAHNSLFVSTDMGSLYCFEGGYKGKTEVFASDFSNYAVDIKQEYKDAANEIMEKSGIKSGYCLDLECGEGSLIYELAKRTNLKIVALEKDKKKLSSQEKCLMVQVCMVQRW